MKRRIKAILKDTHGSMGIVPIAIVLAITLLSAACYGGWKVNNVSDGVYDSVQGSISEAVQQNDTALYDSEKDMYAAAYVFDNASEQWNPQVDTSAITNCLSENLQLQQNGDAWIKYDSSGSENYSLSDFSVSVYNPSLASTGTSESFSVTVNFTLTIPVYGSVPIRVPMHVKSGEDGKF
jgi:hypothetical protein